MEEEIQQYRDDPNINVDTIDFNDKMLPQRQQSGISMLSDFDDEAEMMENKDTNVAPSPKTINMANLRKRLSVSTTGTDTTVQQSNQNRSKPKPTFERKASINESLMVDVTSNTVRRGASPKSTRMANLQNFMFGKQHAEVLDEERKRLAKEKKDNEDKKQKEKEEEERKRMEEEEKEEEEEELRIRLNREVEEKESILKLLKDQKATLIKETKGLQEEVATLSAELTKEEDAGASKMQQLRIEMARLKKATGSQKDRLLKDREHQLTL